MEPGVIIETNGNNLESGFESLWGYKIKVAFKHFKCLFYD